MKASSKIDLHPMLVRSAHRVERTLDTSEAIFHALDTSGAFRPVNVVLVEGPLTIGLLREAIAHVQERHPLLRARIADGPTPRWFTPWESAPPLTVAAPGDDPIGVAETMLHEVYRVGTEPLWRCTLVPDSVRQKRNHLVLATHHAIADGRSEWRIMADLLATCSALVNGTPLLPYLPVGPTLDEVIARAPARAMFFHRLHRVRERLLRRWGPTEKTWPSTKEKRSRVVFRTIPAHILSLLHDRAHADGITLTGVFAAALLLSMAEGKGPRRSMNLSHPVCLRARASPPITPDSVGCFVTSVATRHHVDARDSPWPLAKEVNGKLRTLLARGAPEAGLLAARQGYRRIRARIDESVALQSTAIPLSNLGALTLGDVSPFTLVECHSASTNHVHGGLCHLICASVRGELSLGFAYVEPLLSREKALFILDRFEALLGDMCKTEHFPVPCPAVGC